VNICKEYSELRLPECYGRITVGIISNCFVLSSPKHKLSIYDAVDFNIRWTWNETSEIVLVTTSKHSYFNGSSAWQTN